MGTTAGKKGLRCTGLKMVIPPDIWIKDLIPYYTVDGPKPDISPYKKKKKSADIRDQMNKKLKATEKKLETTEKKLKATEKKLKKMQTFQEKKDITKLRTKI